MNVMLLYSFSMAILLAQFNDVVGTPFDLAGSTTIYESPAAKVPSKVFLTLPVDGETAVDDVDETDDPQEVPSVAAAAAGCLDGNCTSGNGTMKYSSGAEYVGEFLNGARNGMGVYTYGTQNAQGRAVQSPTISYSGMFRNSMKHGKGLLTWRNGNKYDGDFIDNQIQGFGIKTYEDGRKYEGYWKDGKREGYGHLTHKDGSHYFGQYNDNQKHDVSGYALYISAKENKWFAKYEEGELVKSQAISVEGWVKKSENSG